MCPKSPEYIAGFFSVLRAGGIVVPISPELNAPEVMKLVEEMRVDAVCYSPGFDRVIPRGDRANAAELPVGLHGGSSIRVKRLLDSSTPPWEREQLLKAHAATVLFTSGTTAKAKGVILSHAAILERARAKLETWAIRKDDRVLWLLSMTTSLLTFLCAFLSQGAAIAIADAMNAEAVPALVTRHNITRVYGSPLFYQMLGHQQDIPPGALSGVK